MAGAGYKLFNTGDVLTAAQVNTYLNEQTVMVFASSAARTSALSGVLAEGMMSYLQDTNAVEVYNGSSWVNVGNAGDITEVQAGTGISVASGTGPIPVITNTVATAFDAAGDLVYGTGADTFTKLSLGTAGQVLKVNSGATAPEWGAATGGGSLTEITSGSLPTGVATLTLSSGLSGYTDLRLVVRDIYCASNAYLQLRVNSDTGSNYGYNQFNNTPVDTSAFNADNVRTEILLSSATIYNADKNNFYTITFNDYANTSSYKTIYSQNVIRNGSDSFFAIEPTWGAYFGGTGAITSITIFAGSNFSGGTYILYGVK